MQILCVLLKFVLNCTPPIPDSHTLVTVHVILMRDRLASDLHHFAQICGNLRCICADSQAYAIVACYWACSKTICGPWCVLHSSAAIQDHTSHLPTLSALYLSLTCVNLRFYAFLEAQTDADWRSSVECQYNTAIPLGCGCLHLATTVKCHIIVWECSTFRLFFRSFAIPTIQIGHTCINCRHGWVTITIFYLPIWNNVKVWATSV